MLEVKNLEVVYSDVILVLRGISLSIPDGSIVALLGANGAGKTTTLRAVSGLLDVHNGNVTKGEILLDGEPIHRKSAAKIVRLGVSQALEGRRILAEMSVDENLRLGAHTNHRSMDANMERVYHLFPLLRDRAK
ncbi:MAG: ATP-binding cassette domain-containing protein, partial [Actinobacteria bacterium]|nr:ATP-binding cassette domain-containing protein [Actinomycetota bacterium]